MRDEALCWIGLTQGRARLAEILPLLTEARRTAIQTLLDGIGELTPADVRARWKQMRDAELDEMCKRAAEEAGIEVELMPPFLQEWICERARNA